jgi:hypothetical protein
MPAVTALLVNAANRLIKAANQLNAANLANPQTNAANRPTKAANQVNAANLANPQTNAAKLLANHQGNVANLRREKNAASKHELP